MSTEHSEDTGGGAHPVSAEDLADDHADAGTDHRAGRESEHAGSGTDNPPPSQIVVSNAFAERVGRDGVRRWSEIIGQVSRDTGGADPSQIADLLTERLGNAGLGGPPVETRRLAEILAGRDPNRVTFVDDAGHPISGPTPEDATRSAGSAHTEPESGDRPMYS